MEKKVNSTLYNFIRSSKWCSAPCKTGKTAVCMYWVLQLLLSFLCTWLALHCAVLSEHIKQSCFSQTVLSRGHVVCCCDDNGRVNVRMGLGDGLVGHSVIWFRAGSNQEWQFPVLKRREGWCIMHEQPVLGGSYCFTLFYVLVLLLYYTQLQTYKIYFPLSLCCANVSSYMCIDTTMHLITEFMTDEQWC